MNNKELANAIVSAIRDPENLNHLSIHGVEMTVKGETLDVEVLAFLNTDFTFSPLAIFCTPEVSELLELEKPEPQK